MARYLYDLLQDCRKSEMGLKHDGGAAQAVRVTNRNGASSYLLVCDHASNRIPAEYASLGLEEHQLSRHIAWDPGAAEVCNRMSRLLDAALVESQISRLVIDCNRPLDAPDLIAAVSETTTVPGNANLSAVERARRVAIAYDPYHAAVEELVWERLAMGASPCLIAVHSFNPTYAGVSRPWQVGVIHDEDERISRPLLAALNAVGGLTAGDNQPYSPADRVYHTLERHARARGLPCVMVEIRNDEIADAEGQRKWAVLLAEILVNIGAAPVHHEQQRQEQRRVAPGQ